MKEAYVNKLRAKRKELIENIKVDDSFWLRFIDNRTLTREHVQMCQAEITKEKSFELLLDMMERRDDSCFQKFCQALSVANADLVKKCLDDYQVATPVASHYQTETVAQLNDSNIAEHLEQLRKVNAELSIKVQEETSAFNKREITNAGLQIQLEDIKNTVRRLELQRKQDEENYESSVKDLATEKSRISELGQKKESLENEINTLEAQLKEKKEKKDALLEEVKGKARENTKLEKRIAFQKTHISSLGSRSFSEDLS